jgi:hypothetical protein
MRHRLSARVFGISEKVRFLTALRLERGALQAAARADSHVMVMLTPPRELQRS